MTRMIHAPRKRFGQHFLVDTHIIQALVDVIGPSPDQHIVEIGPGRGALTFPVLKQCQAMDVVELDRDLIPLLTARSSHYGQLTIYEADALTFNFSELVKEDKALRVIGNLPYNISTPLIFHLLTFSRCIIDMHFMLQKEVVDRLAASIGSGDYGRLSIMVQYHCAVSALFDVPPESFDPPPKVDSAIVRLVPFDTLPYVAKDYAHFAMLVKQAFSQRRKTLRNCLKLYMQDADWQASGIDPQLRPEQLTVQQYVALSNALNP